jgi:hypothetical protein
MSLKIIRSLWVFGHAAAIIAWHLPASLGVPVMGVAVAAMMVAYFWAIGRSMNQGWWSGAIAFFPPVMWGYIFGLAERQPTVLPQQAPPPVERRTTTVLTMQPQAQVNSDTLAIRQALETIEEAERRYPDW